jgi:hypothetical protein
MGMRIDKIVSYAEAAEFLGGQFTEKSMGKIATTMRRVGSDILIRYHRTDVVTIHSDGTYTLRDGSYQTDTTKKRINDYSPAVIFQSNWTWYILRDPAKGWGKDNTVLFQTGMRVDAAGRLIEAAA